MIIVSQDKNNIVNFDNVMQLENKGSIEEQYLDNGMKEVRYGERFYIIAHCLNTDIVLGEYTTEERAKEVLQKTIREYIDCNESKTDHWQYGYGYVSNSVYEMPEN